MRGKINITPNQLKELLPSANERSSQIISDCPYCGKKGHFYVNKTSLLWDCKKCHEEGNGFKLLSHLGVLDQFYKRVIDTKNLVKLVTELEEESDEVEVLNLPSKKLPLGFERVYTHPYLIDRGLTVKDFYKYKIGISRKSKKLKDYVIILVEEAGDCKGYVSRCTLPKEIIEEFNLLRYRNSTGNKFSQLLFGWEEITRRTKTVIVVEGVFDKIRLDNLLMIDDFDDVKVVCTFGNKMSKNQIDKLRLTNVETVILFYDLDAINEMKRNTPSIKRYFELKIACLLGGKDPGDADEQEIFEALYSLYEPSVFFREKCNGRKIKI